MAAQNGSTKTPVRTLEELQAEAQRTAAEYADALEAKRIADEAAFMAGVSGTWTKVQETFGPVQSAVEAGNLAETASTLAGMIAGATEMLQGIREHLGVKSTSSGSSRNGPFRPHVEAWLREQYAKDPTADFGPSQVAKETLALGHGSGSGGAAAVALDALVRDGAAIQTSEAPKRYRAVSGPVA